MSTMKSAKEEIRENSIPMASRKPRADGIQSRRTILDAAARLATVRGLEGLSIGDLAEHIGMSKSGLYAHFKSKEELELATIDTAAEIFKSDVIQKVSPSVRGIARVNALTEAFLQHLLRRIFPGGCFFATVAAQLASQPGHARDRVMRLQAAWVAQFVLALRQGSEVGDLPRDADVDQLAFEITAMMFRANFAWIVTEDEDVLDRARVGVRNVLAHATQGPRMRRQGKRKT
jgi:AcrR family transcriptional regulator